MSSIMIRALRKVCILFTNRSLSRREGGRKGERERSRGDGKGGIGLDWIVQCSVV